MDALRKQSFDQFMRVKLQSTGCREIAHHHCYFEMRKIRACHRTALASFTTAARLCSFFLLSSFSKYHCASSAAIQPVPAAIIACLYTWSCTSPAANIPGTLVLTPSVMMYPDSLSGS